MVNLLDLFSTDRGLLEARGSLIIRQLCLNLNTERIYRTFAEILEKEEVRALTPSASSLLTGIVGPRVRERYGAEAKHDPHHLARTRRVPQTAEES